MIDGTRIFDTQGTRHERGVASLRAKDKAWLHRFSSVRQIKVDYEAATLD
jgi:hypothetical protein